MHDVKVQRGNNRQFDLLAVNLKTKQQFHIESSVTHCERWQPTTAKLFALFDKKFFGVPPVRTGPRTDHSRGRQYKEEIFSMYSSVGFSAESVERVFCCWVPPSNKDLMQMISDYSSKQGIRPITVLSFRDEVLPRLEKKIATSNYEDEALRTLSLLQQKVAQTGKIQAGTGEVFS